jgi:hypothetical protein
MRVKRLELRTDSLVLLSRLGGSPKRLQGDIWGRVFQKAIGENSSFQTWDWRWSPDPPASFRSGLNGDAPNSDALPSRITRFAAIVLTKHALRISLLYAIGGG